MSQASESRWPATLPAEDGKYEHYSISTQRVIKLARVDIDGLKWREQPLGLASSVSPEDATKKALELAIGDVWVVGYQVGEARQQSVYFDRQDPELYNRKYEPMTYIGEIKTREEFLSEKLDDRRSKAPAMNVAGGRASHVVISRTGTIYPVCSEVVVLSQRDAMQRIGYFNRYMLRWEEPNLWKRQLSMAFI